MPLNLTKQNVLQCYAIPVVFHAMCKSIFICIFEMNINIFCTDDSDKFFIFYFLIDTVHIESEGTIGLFLSKIKIKPGELLPGSTLTYWSYSSFALHFKKKSRYFRCNQSSFKRLNRMQVNSSLSMNSTVHESTEHSRPQIIARKLMSKLLHVS